MRSGAAGRPVELKLTLTPIREEVKVQTIPLQVWTCPQSSRRLRLPEFLDYRHTKVERLSAIRTGRLYPQEIYLVLISVRGWADRRVNSAAGRIMSMNKSQLIEPATIQLVAQCLTQLRRRVSHEGEAPMRNENVHFHLIQCNWRQDTAPDICKRKLRQWKGTQIRYAGTQGKPV
jgi:hypothetical protein